VRSSPAPEPGRVPSMAPGSGVGPMVGEDEPEIHTAVHPGLPRGVRAELVFAAVVLAFTSVLVNTSPPHSILQPTQISAVIGTGKVRFDTFFGPAESGKPNTLHSAAARPRQHTPPPPAGGRGAGGGGGGAPRRRGPQPRDGPPRRSSSR